MESNLIFLLYGSIYSGLVLRTVIKRPGLILKILQLEVDGIAEFMGDRDTGIITTWTHMSTNDLFVARWIYLDSLKRGKPSRLAVLVQMVMGPAGLFLYLLTRRKGPGGSY